MSARKLGELTTPPIAMNAISAVRRVFMSPSLRRGGERTGEPVERCLHSFDCVARLAGRSPHHDHGKAELARRDDLRLGGSPAARFADQHVDRMVLEMV